MIHACIEHVAVACEHVARHVMRVEQHHIDAWYASCDDTSLHGWDGDGERCEMVRVHEDGEEPVLVSYDVHADDTVTSTDTATSPSITPFRIASHSTITWSHHACIDPLYVKQHSITVAVETAIMLCRVEQSIKDVR